MSPDPQRAFEQDLGHVTSGLLFITLGGIITAIIFRYKKRSWITGAFIGACVTGVVTILLNLTIYPIVALWVGLMIFLPKMNPQSGTAQTTFQAGTSRPPRTPDKNSIFISYRREDSAEVVGRIYDRLVQHFGKDAVFKDIDSIPYGVDSRTYLMERSW